ncbi:hypothetical protein HPB48_013410 [Haemaphysalis longicornis]|uniref:Uncharacterized protein n=1 Tax=Haemaphysalis longicornis TaxID=44386 RepID=A0A9J6GIH3_HAELO|nr:hypothetical protein HPB48_013410 [Haemaphysalis longicornis]
MTCHLTSSRNRLSASWTTPGSQSSPHSPVRPPPQVTTASSLDLIAALMSSAISWHPSHPSRDDANAHLAAAGTPDPRPFLTIALPSGLVSLAIRAPVRIIAPSAVPPASARSSAHAREIRRPDTGGGKWTRSRIQPPVLRYGQGCRPPRFLVDTTAEVSVLPASSLDRRGRDMNSSLIAANNSPTNT